MRYVYICVCLVLIDQVLVRVADHIIRKTPDFFENVLERADLSPDPNAKGSFKSCEIHRVLLIYTARTCFDRYGVAKQNENGEYINIIGLRYWAPLSKIFWFFSDYYYSDPCCFEGILRTTQNKEIIKDFRNE